MSDYTNRLADAISEAKRFIKTAEAARKRAADDTYFAGIVGTKESGAARRASMDLSRSLARLRGRPS